MASMFRKAVQVKRRYAAGVLLRWKNYFVFIFTYFLTSVGNLVPQYSVFDNIEKCVVKIRVTKRRKLKIDGGKENGCSLKISLN